MLKLALGAFEVFSAEFVGQAEEGLVLCIFVQFWSFIRKVGVRIFMVI